MPNKNKDPKEFLDGYRKNLADFKTDPLVESEFTVNAKDMLNRAANQQVQELLAEE